MPDLHPRLIQEGRQVIEHGLDAVADPDLVPLSFDVVEGDVAAVLFSHDGARAWVIYEYATEWSHIGLTAIRAGVGPPSTAEVSVEVHWIIRERSRIRRWSLRGRHLVHGQVLRTKGIARLHVDSRIVATPHDWAIMVWRGRDMPAYAVPDV
ncbi:hypothetical protein AB0I81_15095 [Nonomuraea sp. NPDC050404]|uniref:hypothetical protein n=1 Tax=Nonomuraea sp. NPDC050404 TaxID=3155783 RepID=UPI0033FD17F4